MNILYITRCECELVIGALNIRPQNLNRRSRDCNAMFRRIPEPRTEPIRSETGLRLLSFLKSDQKRGSREWIVGKLEVEPERDRDGL